MTNEVRNDPTRAQEIINHLPVTVYRTTPDGRILEGNRAVEHLLGYTVDEFTSMHADELYFRPEDRGPFMRSRLDGADADVVHTVLHLKRKDGQAVWVEDVGRAIKDLDGNIQYFDGTLLDITDKMEAEQELREREAMLATIHDKAPIAIFNLDPNGKVFQANPQAHRMLGLEEGDLLGKTISEFTFSDDAEASHQAFRRLKDGDVDEISLDKRYRRIDGKAIWGHVRAVAIRNPDGSFAHTISLVQDITRRKRTEDAFRLLDELTRQVNEAGNLEEALKAVLDSICESIGFPYAEAWLPDETGELHLSPAWHGEESREFLKFRHMSGKLTFRSGEGLPGACAEADEAIWFDDLSHARGIVRAASAASAGLRSSVCVPVRSQDRLVATIIFLDGAREVPSDHTMRLVKFLADRLGSTVARRRLEIQLNEQARIMEAQIEGASEGILVASGDGRILGMNRTFLAMCGVDTDAIAMDISAMDVFERERGNDDFMNRMRRLYEDRTDGADHVKVDKHITYHRRFVPLGVEGGGQVWYFTRESEDDAT